ncbi:hypothetical protein ABRT01_15535 [Lentibacillus sp. L22]|uniref:hypothetical protein n=1 Tax=Lentibacillus TaxID=175304 RepID=UPI0022B0CA21|nr:hypothetical protein [Lentibacillus daqui]
MKGKVIGIMILLFTAIALATGGYFYFRQSPEDMAQKAVDTFYTYEQDGAFSESWAMFHPQMKEKIDKVQYLQIRPHVFLNDFGVDTFTYTLGEPEKTEGWTMEEGAEPIDVAYKVTVTQTFKGKFGNFNIVQDVYTTLVKGEWTILWDYGDR